MFLRSFKEITISRASRLIYSVLTEEIESEPVSGRSTFIQSSETLMIVRQAPCNHRRPSYSCGFSSFQRGCRCPITRRVSSAPAFTVSFEKFRRLIRLNCAWIRENEKQKKTNKQQFNREKLCEYGITQGINVTCSNVVINTRSIARIIFCNCILLRGQSCMCTCAQAVGGWSGENGFPSCAWKHSAERGNNC